MGKETQIALGVIGVLVLIVALVLVTRIKGLAPHPDVSIERATSDETDAGPARVERQPTIVQPGTTFDPSVPDRTRDDFADPFSDDPTHTGPFEPPRTYLPLRSAVEDPTTRVERPSFEPSYLPPSSDRVREPGTARPGTSGGPMPRGRSSRPSVPESNGFENVEPLPRSSAPPEARPRPIPDPTEQR